MLGGGIEKALADQNADQPSTAFVVLAMHPVAGTRFIMIPRFNGKMACRGNNC